jgi:hypothetical protein
MKQIYIPSLNIIILFFFKSGSSLYTAFIESWMKWLNIEYDYSEITIVRDRKPKVYLMARNPLERIVSSFYWTKTFDIHSKDNKFPIEKFIEFIDGLEDEVNKTSDNHLLPQSWNLVKGISREETQSYNLTYSDFSNFNFRQHFFPDLEIEVIRLEEFQINFASLITSAAGMMFYPYFKKIDIDVPEGVYYKKTFGKFTEINEVMDSYQKLYTVFLYNFIETSFKINHHHNNLTHSMIEVLRQTPATAEYLLKANKLVKNECDYFGYDNKRHLNMHKFGVI